MAPHLTPYIPESPLAKVIWVGGGQLSRSLSPSPRQSCSGDMMLWKGQDWAPGPALKLLCSKQLILGNTG